MSATDTFDTPNGRKVGGPRFPEGVAQWDWSKKEEAYDEGEPALPAPLTPSSDSAPLSRGQQSA